jgi:hypothetical protein
VAAWPKVREEFEIRSSGQTNDELTLLALLYLSQSVVRIIRIDVSRFKLKMNVLAVVSA